MPQWMYRLPGYVVIHGPTSDMSEIEFKNRLKEEGSSEDVEYWMV